MEVGEECLLGPLKIWIWLKRFKVLIRVLALQKIWVDSVEAGGGGLTDMRRRRRRRRGQPVASDSHLKIHLRNPI